MDDCIDTCMGVWVGQSGLSLFAIGAVWMVSGDPIGIVVGLVVLVGGLMVLGMTIRIFDDVARPYRQRQRRVAGVEPACHCTTCLNERARR